MYINLFGLFSAQVRLGEWDTKTEIDCPGKGNCNEGPLDIAVEKYIAHEGYLKNGNQNGNRHHDIAILRLAKPVEYTGKSFILFCRKWYR